MKENLIGQVFGTFTVIGKINTPKSLLWICRCQCGREINRLTKTVRQSPHCKGCFVYKNVYKSREYTAWRSMISRCEVKGTNDYHRYGGRGVKVHPSWRHDFHAFLRDVGPKPSPKYTLDRFPNQQGDYEPGNVRWATQKEQQNNRSNNTNVTYNGETHNLKQWSEIIGINYVTLHWRWKNGWTGDKLFSKPKSG